MNKAALCAIFTSFLLQSCFYDNEAKLYPPTSSSSGCGNDPVTYTNSIAPLMNQYCNSCHGASLFQSLGGGYNLDGYANIQQYAGQNGLLIKSVSPNSTVSSMPKGGASLSNCDINKISTWINAGAPNN